MRAAPRAASASACNRPALQAASGRLVGGSIAVVGRVRKPVDFAQLLKSPPAAKTMHFVLHHLAKAPSSSTYSSKLSTGLSTNANQPVDDFPVEARWLGVAVPKRHARRAVTRTLIKRQIRSLMQGHSSRLAPGMWLVRLRASFDKAEFPSAASEPLAQAVRAELENAFARAALRRSAC